MDFQATQESPAHAGLFCLVQMPGAMPPLTPRVFLEWVAQRSGGQVVQAPDGEAVGLVSVSPHSKLRLSWDPLPKEDMGCRINASLALERDWQSFFGGRRELIALAEAFGLEWVDGGRQFPVNPLEVHDALWRRWRHLRETMGDNGARLPFMTLEHIWNWNAFAVDWDSVHTQLALIEVVVRPDNTPITWTRIDLDDDGLFGKADWIAASFKDVGSHADPDAAPLLRWVRWESFAPWIGAKENQEAPQPMHFIQVDALSEVIKEAKVSGVLAPPFNLQDETPIFAEDP
jgi:hypothetical protein